MSPKPAGIARYIDHTLLKPDTTPAQIEQLCREAIEHGFAAVCVNSCYVAICRRLIGEKGPIRVCSVVGFPLGAMVVEAKQAEAEQAIFRGADELDMVANVGWLKAKEDRRYLADIKAVVTAARGRTVKVILETCLLTDEEKERATRLAIEAGATFVKTSTGFGSGGATVADVALLVRVVAGRIKVKASGGIRDYDTAMAMIQAGAARIGTSAGVAIIEQERAQRSQG